MIDFEAVGDLLRKNKIQQWVLMKDTPIITVRATIQGTSNEMLVNFVFDRTGTLIRLDVIE
jgi:hypothetical protein